MRCWMCDVESWKVCSKKQGVAIWNLDLEIRNLPFQHPKSNIRHYSLKAFHTYLQSGGYIY
jgi:hypothetical protein